MMGCLQVAFFVIHQGRPT